MTAPKHKATRKDMHAAEDSGRTELHRSQSERFIAKARELGLDEREETFDAALEKVAKRRSSKPIIEPSA